MSTKRPQVSFTAFRVMFYVALEQYQPPRLRLLDDGLAASVLPGRLRLLVRLLALGPLREGFLGAIERRFPGTRAASVRKRYIDEQLVQSLARGIEAVVILGSGLDTAAYRIPQLSNLTLYEVDLPETIAYKEAKLRELYGATPPHVKLVPVDFTEQAPGEALRSHGYLPEQKTFFVCEGLTQYIPETAVRRIFDFLATVSPGSRSAFTYITKEFIDGKRTFGQDRLYEETRVKSAIWQFGLDPSEVPEFLGRYSWTLVEDIGAEEYRERYLAPRGRTDKLLEIERMVLAEKSPR